MSAVLEGILADLVTQGDELDTHVAGLGDAQWRTPTPAAGWDVATQIAHLAWTDRVAIAAATDKERWDGYVLEAIADPDHAVDNAAFAGAQDPPADLLARWREGRRELVEVLRAVPPGERLPWFGPPMSPASMGTARFMETWAHGLDVHDALVSAGTLAVRPAPTDRIAHVAHIGVRTRDFAFHAHDRPAPEEEFRVELTAPSGAVWAYGPPDATQRVTGSADDFCRLVTQRVHRADTDLVALGSDADAWLDIAQAFAGRPGPGRDPQ